MESTMPSVSLSNDDNEPQNKQLSLLKKVNLHKRFGKEYVSDAGIQLLKEARKGNVDKVVDLLCRGAPFIADSTGVSPLHFAAFNNSVEITELLLNGGMLRDLKNKVDRTPLHIAAQMNHFNIVKTLLTYGADPNVIDMLNMTPLHWAIEYGNIESVKTLLQYGSSVLSIDNFGRLPIDIAKENQLTEIIYLLENKNSIFKIPEKPKVQNEVVEMEINEDQNNKKDDVKNQSEPIVNEKPIKSEDSNSSQSASSTPPPFISIEKDTLEMLKQHGIQMLEPDKVTTVHSAVECGQKVVLTEAGKLALDTVSRGENKKNNIPMESNSPSSVVIQNGKKSISITGRLTTLDLEKGKPFLKKVGPALSIRYFEGRQYSEEEDEILKHKLQCSINKLRQEGKLLDVFAKRKFRQANVYNQQLLSLHYLNKKQNQQQKFASFKRSS